MVKIRLRRIGTKARPFYRVVIAQSTAGRNGKFVENIGTYDPLAIPKVIKIDEERALHWLMNGAQPTETTAYLLNKIGVMPKYFESRPHAKKQYSFLDKRTAAISKSSAVGDAPAAEPVAAAPASAPAPVEEKALPVSKEKALPVEATDEAAASPAAPTAEAPATETTAETPVPETPAGAPAETAPAEPEIPGSVEPTPEAE